MILYYRGIQWDLGRLGSADTLRAAAGFAPVLSDCLAPLPTVTSQANKALKRAFYQREREANTNKPYSLAEGRTYCGRCCAAVSRPGADF
jgi:hypothetical protein